MKAPIPNIFRDLFDLTGYRSIVTGASMGIGLSLAEALAYLTGQTLHVNGGLLMVD